MDVDTSVQECTVCRNTLDICVDRFECRKEDCGAIVCVSCFSRGGEAGPHRNDHPYAVLSAKYPLLEWDWSGSDEIKLLEAVESCGFGNWVDIARTVGKAADVCQSHYIRHYLYGDCAVTSSRDTDKADKYLGRSQVSYYRAETPLRPELGSTDHFENLAGYLAPRGDFFDEPDPSAEKTLTGVNFAEPLSPFDKELQLTIVDIYRRRVLKRERIKEIVADHGLLDAKQNTEWFARYAKNMSEPKTRALLPLTQLINPDSFMYFMESLNSAEELQKYIKYLKAARENGLKNLIEIPQFKRLDQLRRIHRSKPTLCRNVFKNLENETTLQKFLQKKFREEVAGSSTVSAPDFKEIRRKKPTPSPLSIENLQGYQRLTPSEKEFCSILRLFPNTYLNMKSQLIFECRRSGGIRLSRARAVCNIDVNKTKKLYEFLISQDVIHR